MKDYNSMAYDSGKKYRNILKDLLEELERMSNSVAIQGKVIKDLVIKYKILLSDLDNEMNKKITFLNPSFSYIINTDQYKEEVLYKMIENTIGKYYSNGLFILKENPENHYLKKNLLLKNNINPRFVWLTNISGNFEKISPSNLLQIQKLIMDYLKENSENKSLILLEGLEIIKTYNDIREIIKYLTNIKDQISMSKSFLLIPFHFSAFSQEEIGMLKGNFYQIN